MKHVTTTAIMLMQLCCTAEPLAEPTAPDAGSSGAHHENDGSSSSAGADADSTSDGGSTGEDSSSTGPQAGVDAFIEAFSGEHFYYLPEDDQRTRQVDLAFPEDGSYEHIALHLGLRCPEGGCDDWDRIGWIGLVTDDGRETERVVELVRFITPFKLEATWEDIDVTALRPLLRGDVTLRAYLSTGVGPGHPNGAGWLLHAAFEMRGGHPQREPLAVVPLWNVSAGYGDPNAPLSDSFPEREVSLPAETTGLEVRTFVTGHGQGNADNCAEFCAKTHGINVGAEVRSRVVWRDDCTQTAVPGQPGTWQFSRAGWCPGAMVEPWIEDVSDALVADSDAMSTTARYDIEAYVNTCHPDAAEAPACVGCTLGTSCDFDGGNHTSPRFMVSSLLIAYGPS